MVHIHPVSFHLGQAETQVLRQDRLQLGDASNGLWEQPKLCMQMSSVDSLAVWPYASHFTALCYMFLICSNRDN